MDKKPIVCAACGSPDPDVFFIGELRLTACQHCHHSQRIDVEPFDYAGFAMGGTGLAPARLAAQAGFIAARLDDGVRALEIGCAAGDLAQELRRQKTFAAYDGVEFSPARELASERMNRVFSTPLTTLLSTGEILPASYDIVLSSHCLEHLDDPSAMIAAMCRAMKPDGLLFIETPNRSGHARLPFDDNRTHLHFFGALSLASLLARHGLEILAVETGARLDARYSDCLRVMARRHAIPKADSSILSSHAMLAGIDKLVVWGAGRMVEEMLAPYFDPDRIAFFVDRDVRKQGERRLGAPIYSPEALNQGAGWVVLVNSLEMEAAIRADIAAHYSAHVARVIGVGELLS